MKPRRRLLICFAIVLTVILSGCSTTKDQASTNPSPTTEMPDIPPSSNIELGLFGADFSQLSGDANAAANALYKICYNQPEALASTVAAFPHLLEKCGIDTNDPIKIDEAMDTAPDNQLQIALLDQLLALLEADTTEIGFSTANGSMYTWYMYTKDPTQELSIINVGLIRVPVFLNERPVMEITTHLEDDVTETGVFDLCSGFQRCVDMSHIR